MDIRELSIDNIENIKKLMLDIFSGEPWNDVWTDKQLHAYVSELTGNKNSLSFGVYLDGNLIGMALGRIKSWYEGTEYWIEEFGILPDRQQSGIGSAFIEELEKILAEKGSSTSFSLRRKMFPPIVFIKRTVFGKKKKMFSL